MVEVKIKELKYIKDIPLEFLKIAIDAGEVRKGNTIGLMVRPVGVVSEEDVLIELKLTSDGQEELIREGAVIPIEGCNSVCFLGQEWTVYLERFKSSENVRLRKDRGFVPSESIRERRLSPGAVSD